MKNRRLSFESCEGRRMMSASPITIEAESMNHSGFVVKQDSTGRQAITNTVDNKGTATVGKAGLYNGVGQPGSGAGTTGTGAGRDSFYALKVSH